VSEPPPDYLFELTASALSSASPANPGPPAQLQFAEAALTPSPSAPNLVRPQPLRDAVSTLSGRGARRETAALVIPDYAVRMSVLDFEDFPSNETERTALIRFRLRKSVPFHIEEAAVSYSVQMEAPKRVEVLAVAIARPILLEYEGVFTEAGYRVGLVLPSSLAALPLWRSDEDGLLLVAKVVGVALSILLVEGPRVRLVRSLDLGESEAGAESGLLGPLQQTLAYAEDQIGLPVKRVLLCGFGHETEAVGKLLQSELGVPSFAARSRFGVPGQRDAGLLGLLERYAA
jgi:type IV pilus assembly protein PilM